MARKRPLEDVTSAAPGAKKARLEDRHDDDDDETMDDAPPEFDEPQIPRVVLDNLDYENGDFPEELTYNDDGRAFPGYHNPADPSYVMPMISDASPSPQPVATLAAALPLPELSPDTLSPRIRKVLEKYSKFAELPKSTIDKLLERIRKALLKFPDFATPLVLESAPEKADVMELFQDVKRLDGDWIGVEGKLGKGGQGCARLFVRVDDQNRITERIVIKDSFQNLVTWTDETWWERGRIGLDPRESIVNKLLSLPTPARWERYIVEYLGHAVNHQWKTNRTYMEYCDGGDLHKLIKAQMKE